jgi:hypothetical protein
MAASLLLKEVKPGDQSVSWHLYFGWSIAVKECETQIGHVKIPTTCSAAQGRGLVQGSVQGYDCFWFVNYNNWLRWWYLNNLSL